MYLVFISLEVCIVESTRFVILHTFRFSIQQPYVSRSHVSTAQYRHYYRTLIQQKVIWAAHLSEPSTERQRHCC